MSKLKNGKELAVALKEVAVFKEKAKSLQGKYGYYEKSEYYERLCQVFGVDGFSLNYEFGGLHTLPTNQIFGVGKCVIGLLDEAGNVVYSVSGLGTEEIEFSDKNSKYIMLNNVGSGVDTAAFKEACRQLNIFNCVMEKKPENKTENSSSSSTSTAVEKKQFRVVGSLVENGECKFTHKPVYKQKMECDGKEIEVLFYPNNYTKDEYWNMYFEGSGLGKVKTVTLNCEKARNGTGYIFKSFVINKEA